MLAAAPECGDCRAADSQERAIVYSRNDFTPQEKIVFDFISAYRDSWPPDLAAALDPLTDDAYYQIVVPTSEPIRGREAILKCHQRMKDHIGDQRHTMKNVVSYKNTVVTERVDQSFEHGHWVSIPLCAVFELNDDGKIFAWREYLDLAHVAKQNDSTAETLLGMLEKISEA